MSRESMTEQHGLSLRDALAEAGAFERKSAIVYYSGKDGSRAIYDVTAYDMGECVINGRHCETPEGQIGFFRTLSGSEAYFKEHGIDTEHGWNKRP